MLVLSRKLGEKIQIGEDICITVVDIDRGKIRLGIEAPREVPIFRQELLPLGVPPTLDEPPCGRSRSAWNLHVHSAVVHLSLPNHARRTDD